jgi:VRR-NUC domain-containing protein
MQQTIIRWWGLACKGYKLPEFALIAFPNEGRRSPQAGRRMVAEGLRKGVTDLVLAVPTTHSSALWIELKTDTGRIRPEQRDFGIYLADRYTYRVCRSFDEARREIEQHLSFAQVFVAPAYSVAGTPQALGSQNGPGS